MIFYWQDWAGYIGIVLVLLAFLLLQARKLRGHGLIYQLMNVFGAIGVIVSLFGPGPINWSAFLMQLAWLLIGVYGIVNSVRVRREARAAGRPISPW